MAIVVTMVIFALFILGFPFDFTNEYSMASEWCGRGVRTSGGHGGGPGGASDWENFRADKNFFEVLGEPEQDHGQDGDAFDFGVAFDNVKDGFTMEGKHSKRQQN